MKVAVFYVIVDCIDATQFYLEVIVLIAFNVIWVENLLIQDY
jgi:hypothetical protein